METIRKEKKLRFRLIDEYRGFWIVNMIVYHGIWDLVYIFGCNWQWFRSDWAHLWQQWGCWSFIFISGFCWQMSRQNLKRGLLVFGAGLLITVVTLIFMPSSRVIFGVLTLLGSSMLLMIPCHKLFKACERHVPCFSLIGAIASFVIFLFVYPVNNGYLGFGGEEMVTLPSELYGSLFTTYLGFTEPGFWSTDYFSLLPWFFMYAVGYFTYNVFIGTRKEGSEATVPREKAVQVLSVSICPPLGWIGRNSLIIYMLHQPVVYGVLYVINLAK